MFCTRHAGHAYSSRLTFRDVPITNIRKEPCGRWMIVLLMVMSFIIAWVDRMCQSFLSGCVFSTIVFVVAFDLSFACRT